MESSGGVYLLALACGNCEKTTEECFPYMYVNPESLKSHHRRNHVGMTPTFIGCKVEKLPSKLDSDVRQENLRFICLDSTVTELTCGSKTTVDFVVAISDDINTKDLKIFQSFQNASDVKQKSNRTRNGEEQLELVLNSFEIQKKNLDSKILFSSYEPKIQVEIYFQNKFIFLRALSPEAQIRITGSMRKFEDSDSLSTQRITRATQIFFFMDTPENTGCNARLESWATLNMIECFTNFFMGELKQGPAAGVDSRDLSIRKRIFYYLIEIGVCASFEKIFTLLKDLIFLCFISRVIIFSKNEDCNCLALLDQQLGLEPVSNFYVLLKKWKSNLKILRKNSEGSIIPKQIVFSHPSNKNQIVIGSNSFPIEIISHMYRFGLKEFNSAFAYLCRLLPFSSGPSSATMEDICCKIFARDVIDNYSSTGPVLENGYHLQLQTLLFVGFQKVRETASVLREIKELLHELSCIMLFLIHLGGGNPPRAGDYVNFSFLGINRNAFFLKDQIFSLMRNVKVEGMLGRQLDLIPRGYPSNLADAITRYIFVLSPLQAFVNLSEARTETEKEIALRNSKENFFFFHGAPPKGKSSLRYYLNIQLSLCASKYIITRSGGGIDKDNANTPVLSIKSYRHLQAFMIYLGLIEGNLILSSEIEEELRVCIGRALKDLSLIHNLLVMTAVPEQSEQGGRSEGTFLIQYGNGFNSIDLGGTLVTAKHIQKGISVSKLAHHLLNICSLHQTNFLEKDTSVLAAEEAFGSSRSMQFQSFNDTFKNVTFLPLTDGGFDQLEYGKSFYACIIEKCNSLFIAPTGSGKTTILLNSILVGTQKGNQVAFIVLPTATQVRQVIQKANAIREGSAMTLADLARNPQMENARNLFDAGCVNAQLRFLVCTPEALSAYQLFISSRLLAFSLIYAIFWDDCQDGGDPFCFRKAFTYVAELFSLAITPGAQVPFMMCMSGSIPFEMESSILKNLFVPSFLKHHNNTLPKVFRFGSAVNKKISWNLVKASNLYESLTHCISMPDFSGDVMIFVPDYRMRDQMRSFLKTFASTFQGMFAEFMFIDRDLEEKNKGLFDQINLTMQHQGQEDPNEKRYILVSSQICGSGIDFPNVNKVIIINWCFSICAGFQSGGRCGRNGKAGKVFVISDNWETSKDPLVQLFLTEKSCLQNLLSLYFDGPSLPGNSPMCENCSFCFESARLDPYQQKDQHIAPFIFLEDEQAATKKRLEQGTAGDDSSTPNSATKKSKLVGDTLYDFSNMSKIDIQEKAKKFIGPQKTGLSINILQYMKFMLRLEQQCILQECSDKHLVYGECSLLPKHLCFGCGLSIRAVVNKPTEIICTTRPCERFMISKSNNVKEWICVNCFSQCSLERDACATNTRENPKILMVLVLHLCYLAKFDFRVKWKDLLQTPKAEDRFLKFRTLFNDCNARIGNKLRISLWEQ